MRIPVSTIMLSYNTKDLTRKALKALFCGSAIPAQVIVVDNNSQDGSAAMVRSEFPQVTLIENEDNIGFAKANNLAIRQYVDQPYIWLLNSDTEVGKDSLLNLFDYLEAHKEVVGVEPSLVYPDRSLQSVGGFFPTSTNVLLYLFPVSFFFPQTLKRKIRGMSLYPQPIPETGLLLDYITGAASMFRRSILDEVGLLGEEYFMYFEETDLCWRIKQAGHKLLAVNTDPVMHVYGGSYKKKTDPNRLKIFLQSLKIFVNKNYTGFRKYFILAEIFLFGRLSIWIKGLKK